MTYLEAVRQFKRGYWIDVLARCDHNITAAARMAGVQRQHVYRILRVLDVPHAPLSRIGGHRGNWGDLRRPPDLSDDHRIGVPSQRRLTACSNPPFIE
jgi:hypothetical protein